MVVQKLIGAGRSYFSRRNSIERQLRRPGKQNDISQGLVPSNIWLIPDSGIYATPNTPADPTDCTRYPDSPFCGGTGISLIGFGALPEVILTDCDIGIRLNLSFFYISLPPVSVVYRKPECRKKALSDPPSINHPLPNDCGMYRFLSESTTLDNDFALSKITKVEHIPGAYINNRDAVSEDWIIFAEDCQGNSLQIWNYDANNNYQLDRVNTGNKYRNFSDSFGNNLNGQNRFLSPKTDGKILSINIRLDSITYPYNKVDDCKCLPLIPPPPPKDICCMSQCCPPPDNALLKSLIKKVNRLSEVVGVEKFPAKLPERLVYPNSKKEVQIKDLPEFLGYQVKQVDRAVGYLPQKIKVADTNAGLKGNQSVEIEVHSFADFCKQIMQYIIDTEGDGDVTNNMLVRVLYELGFIHQGVVQGDAMLDAIVDHLDFKHRWHRIKVPFAFDPYAGQKGKVGQGFDKQKNSGDNKTEAAVEELLPKLLSNTDVEIRVLINDEKKSLNDMLQDIKRDTAAASAAVAEKSTPENLERLVKAAQLMLQLQSAIDRRNMRQALIAGNLKTRKLKR